MGSAGPLIDVALIHYPVVNRTGEIIGSAITNLDLHDIARAGCTYGVDTYWVVTPDAQQRELAGQIVGHWTQGYGGGVNPDRKQALSRIRICATLDEVLQGVGDKWQQKATVFATCARPASNTVGYADVQSRLRGGEPMLLLFGTAWGLAPEVMAAVDGTLPPIRGCGEFNHLSVRSAVSIILDRLLGDR
ncbi:MAG: RNA methyltransferase [Desulfobulbaceae bacterium]|nr:RNA methyltransferase [Desulfobulbaceae bacterium]